MTSRSQTSSTLLVLTILLTLTLCACQTKTVKVTRITIMERHVIERIEVTVEVTRIQRVIETPKPTSTDIVLPGASLTATPSPTPPPATAPPATARSTSVVTATPASSAKQTGARLLAAIKEAEQTLLSLVPALNSDPLPIANIIVFYDTLRNAPTLTIPEGEAQLQSVYDRYRGQVDSALEQGSDLYAHLASIQAGKAAQTEVSLTHLALARDAASAGTSTLQALIRELESYLVLLP